MATDKSMHNQDAPPARHWTPSQRAAIQHPGGDLIVSAAAGSGKTAVLAERCARLVCGSDSQRCGIENLLVLTFTEAAAGEMKTRIAAAIAEKLHAPSAPADDRFLRRQAAMVDRAAISTLHAFCARILRQHFHEAGVDPAFEVMDQDEARLLQEDVLEELFARWHRLPAEQAQPFTDFFEAYAQGRESTCADIILALYRMKTTTANPADFLSAARAAYAASAEATVIAYFTDSLADQLRLLGIAAQRGLDLFATYPDGKQMLAALQQVVPAIASALQQLAALDDFAQLANALPSIAEVLANSWPPKIMTPKEADKTDFKALKERAYDPVKENAKALAELFKASPAAMLSELKKLAASLETLLTLTEEFEQAFTTAKQSENRLDFADLERLALRLLTAPNNLAAVELRTRFHHLLVDEFQDINPLQAALLNAVRNPVAFDSRGNLFVVGDVKQSIYGFRLADPKLFLDREQAARAADAAHPNSIRQHIALQENFRSHPNLIHIMNALFSRILTPQIAGIDYPRGHELKTASTELTTPPIIPAEVHLLTKQDDTTDDEHESDTAEKIDDEPASTVELEARLVADRIAILLQNPPAIRRKDGTSSPLRHRDIAILMRSAKSRAMIFARALADRGIPVHADLSTGFFDTPEVRHAVALLQTLDNPRQDIPLAATLLGPFGNFSHDDLVRIRLAFDRKEFPFHEAAEKYAIQTTPDDLSAKLKTFFEKLAAWRDKLRGRPLHEGLADIFAESRILTYVAALDAGRQRSANLEMLYQRALKFSTFKKQGLHRFLRFIEKLRQQEEADGGEAAILSEASDVVRIMTIHKSKGLEFPVVFVSGLGAQYQFHDRTQSAVLLHRDLGIGLSVVDIDRNLQYPSVAALRIKAHRQRAFRAEELRLLYVAITRARDRLILTGNINKSSDIDTWRFTWQSHTGPLPEDILLKGRRALDWLIPALTTGAPQVPITLHTAEEFSTTASQPAETSPDAQRILLAKPIPNLIPDQPTLAALTHRVTATYPFAEQSRRPAVQTVSFLKTLTQNRDLAGEIEALPAPGLTRNNTDEPTQTSTTNPDAARLRGLATHRVLELLDFSHTTTPDQIEAQHTQLLADKKLTPDESTRADWPAIHWFLLHSQTIQRIRTAIGGGATQLQRELPFAWVGTLVPTDDPPADLPTIRGIIDLLLVNPAARTAEIIDYKTDSPFLWESRLDEYRLQMQYYMVAATNILNFPVQQATLIFLSPHREIVIAS